MCSTLCLISGTIRLIRRDMRRITRRTALQAAAASALALPAVLAGPPDKPKRSVNQPYLKLSCNLYTFNSLLSSGETDLAQIFDFCASLGFSAVDSPGYYFTGYPAPPDDRYLYDLKRRAFLLGLDISGAGIRNDFTNPDPLKRAADLDLIKAWAEVAAKLGAPVLRVFAGNSKLEGRSREEVRGWVVEGLRRSAEICQQRGVMAVLQNHRDFLESAEQTLEVLGMVDSPWLGLNLDIGGFRTPDPYQDIEKLVPYAVTWQIKENVYFGDEPVPTDLSRLVRIIKAANYRGYLPLETLGAGDAREKIRNLLSRVREAL
jgi:sugar phosphate isomerase/epimerase